jgi:hypothetical protein
MAELEEATSLKNHVKSEAVIITVKVNKDVNVQFLKNGNPKKLPKIGDNHPDNNRPIEAEEGTEQAAIIGYIKWHHHNPDCITIDIGGAQYQVCFP